MTNFDPKRDLADYATREEVARLYEEYLRLDNIYNAGVLNPDTSEEDVQAMNVAADTALDDYEACGLAVFTDGLGHLRRCDVSGAVLLEGDDIAYVLHAALPQKQLLPEMETA